MDKWIDPRFHLACFSSGGGPPDFEPTWQEVRIQGSILHNLAVHDIREEKGLGVVYLDEVGEVNSTPVLARLKVRYDDLFNISPAIAWRAKLTSSDDPEEELEAMQSNSSPGTPDPEWVWLGVQQHRQCKSSEYDPDFPAWANGVEIVESEDPIGSFGVVGYTTKGGDHYFEFAKDYYHELLVREY